MPATPSISHPDDATVLLELIGQDDGSGPIIANATGFYVTIANSFYLVTNWHVVTGKCVETGAQRLRQIPRCLKCRSQNNSDFDVRLYDDRNNRTWLESSESVIVEGCSQKLDVVLIPIQAPSSIRPISSVGHSDLYHKVPLDMLTIVGFPFVRANPIWKTAFVAESVTSQSKYFLVNSRTKPGMSGSPVFPACASSILTGVAQNMPGGLIGIYSARYCDVADMPNANLNDLDLGIVWKSSVLVDILHENRRDLSLISG